METSNPNKASLVAFLSLFAVYEWLLKGKNYKPTDHYESDITKYYSICHNHWNYYERILLPAVVKERLAQQSPQKPL